MNERTCRLRVNMVKKLRKKCGKSWATIAKDCRVHPGTIKRWMAGSDVLMDNIGLLAKALGTSADNLILPEGEEDLTDYVKAEITVMGNLASLDNPDGHVAAILENAQKAIGAKYRVLLMYVGDGSIRIGIKIHAADAIRLVRAFVQGRLRTHLVRSVSINSTTYQPSEAPDLPEGPEVPHRPNVDAASEELLNYFGDFAAVELPTEPLPNTEEVLSCLTNLEKEVIKLRYGLADGYTYTYDEIARVFKKTPRKIIAIERRALDKIRRRDHPAASIFDTPL